LASSFIPRTARNLAPVALAQDAMSLDLRSFLARYGDAPLLLVRIPAGETELELGLNATASNTGSPPSALARPLPFRTTHQPGPRQAQPSEEMGVEQRANVGALLQKHAYFAVPLKKREDGDAMFMDRISVGRANNKDIVLRHASISKFHAWFEVDPSQAVYVSDGGSTNRTQVNGRALAPRISTAVVPGDLVQFGAIETVLCSPESLWVCVNQENGKATAADHTQAS
jgi:hypothetical protein